MIYPVMKEGVGRLDKKDAYFLDVKAFAGMVSPNQKLDFSSLENPWRGSFETNKVLLTFGILPPTK